MLGIDVRAMLGLPELSLHTLAYLPKPSRNEGGAAAYVGKTSHPWIAELQTCLSASLILTTNAGTCHCNVNEAFTQTFMNKEAVDALKKSAAHMLCPSASFTLATSVISSSASDSCTLSVPRCVERQLSLCAASIAMAMCLSRSYSCAHCSQRAITLPLASGFCSYRNRRRTFVLCLRRRIPSQLIVCRLSPPPRPVLTGKASITSFNSASVSEKAA